MNEPKQVKPKDALWEKAVEILKIDPDLYGRAKLGAQLKPFRQLGLAPNDLERWEDWYYQNDWRGKKGDAPTIKVIQETWAQAFRPKGKSRREKDASAAAQTSAPADSDYDRHFEEWYADVSERADSEMLNRWAQDPDAMHADFREWLKKKAALQE
jgi:hypothetical protein